MKPNEARTLTAMAMNCFYADEMGEGSDILNSALAIAPNDEVRSSNCDSRDASSCRAIDANEKST